MTELKTFNQILEECGVPDDNYVGEAIALDKLKAEAVKWVKFYFKGREDSLNIKQYEEADKCEHTAGFIINFFNLTEEDLK